MSRPLLPAVVLVSGRGSNLQAILDDDARAPYLDVRRVISNQPDAQALDRARAAGIEALGPDHRAHASRAGFDAALAPAIDAASPALVVLAGFMRVLTKGFVARYAGRMLNIHPALLPAFPGLHTHARAIAAGVPWHGATVHFVSHEVDGGAVVARARVPVLPGDDAATLAARVLAQEHRLFPRVLRWFTAGRLAVEGGRAWLDGQPLDGWPPERFEA